MRLALLICGLAWACLADDRWVLFRSEAVEVYSEAGPKAGRAALVRFEQFRHALGKVLGEDNLQAAMPLRVLLFRKREPLDRVLTGRDRYAVVQREGTPPSSALQRDLARLYLEAGTRMPAFLERGLIDLFSTLEVTGIRITIGKPPASPNLDWARMALLATSEEYYGKLRVLAYNLRRGAAPEPAYHNAVAKTPAQIDREAQAYLAAGQFGTAPVSSKPMAERDFPERPLEPGAVRLAIADLLLGEESRAGYRALLNEEQHLAEAHEGMALLARDKSEALREFAAAMAAGSKSARAYTEYGRLEPDNAKALAALEQAAKLNSKLAEPHFLMAARRSEPERRIADLKTAATLAARNAAYWQALAEACLEQKNFGEAAKAWTAAEQAAADDASRARYRQARAAIEQQRLDWEAAERRRVAEEKERELERLKAEARAEVRALEARANKGATPESEAVPWWDGPKAEGRAHGALKQVDCLGKQFRLVVEDDRRKLIRLLIADPAKIVISGGGETTLTCGPQKPRRVSVEYFPKNNARLGTVGEVATIQFQ